MKRLAAFLVGITFLIIQPVPAPQGTPVPAAVQRKLDPRQPPAAAPFAAWSYQRDKRLAGAGAVNSPALYRRAERRLERMGRYSTALGRAVDTLDTLDATPHAKTAALGTWEALGPGNVGGRTRALVIHPDRPRTMFAAGVSGGVWKTTNGGARWRPVGDGLANLAVNSLAMDPGDPDVLYAGTGEGYFREVVRETSLPLRGGGIFKSSNGGRSWELLSGTRGKKFHWVNDLYVSPHDSDRLYAATRKGVLRSTDGGHKWKRVLRPKKTRGGCLDLAARSDTDGDYLFASCGTLNGGAVFRHETAEGEGRWERVLAETGQGRTSLAVAPSDQNVVYALASSTVPGPDGNFLQALHAVFRSDQSGAAGSWSATVRNDDPRKVNTLILSNPIVALLEECNFNGTNDYFSMGWYVNVIAVDPSNPDRVWAGGVDLFRSDDGGRTWNPATYWWAGGGRNFVHADHHGLVFHPRDPDVLYSLNDGGVYRTDNARARVATSDTAACQPGSSAVAWRPLNNNYGVTQFYHGTVFPGGETYMGGTQDNGSHVGDRERGRNGWSNLFGGDGGYSAVDPSDLQTLYVTTQNGLIHKSTDGGRNFDRQTTGIDDLATNGADDFRAVGDNFLFIAPLLLDPVEPRRLWSGGVRLWRTDNAAGSWAAASTRLAGRTSALATASGDSDTMLVGTEEGTIHRQANATGADAATEWPGSRPRRGFVSSVAFDPSDPTIAYATYAGFGGEHVWRSTDGGSSWSAIDGKDADSIPNAPVHSIAVDPTDGDRLYLGTDLGVLVSIDGGATWAVENTGFARAVTETLAIATTSDGTRYLYAFTHGRGAWRVELDGSGS